jgi:hypothetical protein
MSVVSRSPLSLSSPDSIMQAALELERNPYVSCLHRLFWAFVDDLQTRIQDSGSGMFPNARNILITGGTFVSHLAGYINLAQLFMLVVFTRSMSTLAKGR